MRAYHIMMFLLVFNLMIWAVDTGLGIYDIDFSGGDDYNPENVQEAADAKGTDYTSHGLLATIAGTSIILIAGTLVAGAIIGNILRIEKASQAYVYGAFTAVFWTSYLSAAGVLWSMTTTLSGAYGAWVVLMIITAVIAYVFVVGLFQMVTGGWKSYE